MTSKRLLILNYEYPPLGGGAGNATYYITHELEHLGYEIDLVTTYYKGLLETETLGSLTIHRVHSRRKRKDMSDPFEMKSYIHHALCKCLSLCKTKFYDSIVSFFAIPTGFVAWRLKKHFAIPYILLLRGADVPGYIFHLSWFWHFVSAPFTKKIWREASLIFANSLGLQALAQKTADKVHQQVHCIVNGIDDSFYHPDPEYRQGNSLRFLFVGRFVGEKGILHILQSLGQLKSEGYPFYCTLVGDGMLLPVIQQTLAAKNIVSEVELLGWLSKDLLKKAYQTHDILLIPSLIEGMPNVMLEAMASGLVIIGTQIAGISDIFKDNGWLIKPNSSEALYEVMEQAILQPDLLPAFRSQSLRRIKDFSWKQTTYQIHEAIQQICLANPET